MIDGQTINNALMNSQLACFTLTPLVPAPTDRRASKFGGQPYWPASMSYPQSASGEPLLLMAQFNLSEFPAEQVGLPSTGILQFFFAPDDLWGLDTDHHPDDVVADPQGYRVIYHRQLLSDDAQLANTVPEVSFDYEDLPFYICCGLRIEPSYSFVGPDDYHFEHFVGHEVADNEALMANINIPTHGTKLGGYAGFTHGDPRRKYHKKPGEWILLFQMDSSDIENSNESIWWGDNGIANFFIEPERLKNADFSRVWYDWG